jgi:hypothetical protein
LKDVFGSFLHHFRSSGFVRFARHSGWKWQEDYQLQRLTCGIFGHEPISDPGHSSPFVRRRRILLWRACLRWWRDWPNFVDMPYRFFDGRVPEKVSSTECRNLRRLLALQNLRQVAHKLCDYGDSEGNVR